jgi:hypothetical protein
VRPPGAELASGADSSGPSAFEAVAARLRRASPRDEVTLEEVPAPTRLAPFAVAFSGEVLRGDEELASGRLILLHDPAGQESWGGDTRLVTVVRAPVEPEMATDPLLGEVAWTWLAEAPTGRGVPSHSAGGAVTRTASARYGDLAGDPETADVELRASWSPGAVGARTGLDEDLVAHLGAWCDLLCAVGGLPPPGVSALPPRSG